MRISKFVLADYSAEIDISPNISPLSLSETGFVPD